MLPKLIGEKKLKQHVASWIRRLKSKTEQFFAIMLSKQIGEICSLNYWQDDVPKTMSTTCC